jgi:hypothetical protein
MLQELGIGNRSGPCSKSRLTGQDGSFDPSRNCYRNRLVQVDKEIHALTHHGVRFQSSFREEQR